MNATPRPTGIDACLQATARGERLPQATQLWLAQQATKLHASCCTAFVTLTDCQALLEASLEPKAMAEVQLVLDTLKLVAVEAEARTCL